MCGILLINDKSLIEKSANKALKTMNHRGPDYTGIIIKENMFIGHNRLSIIDLSTFGNQPMVSSDGDVTIIHNGEIYNYNELKSPMKKFYTFNSGTDTELIMSGYILEGIDFFKKLRGMYAFIIIDERKNQKKIITARDAFGIKPLYIFQKGELLLVASEMKAILSYLDCKQSIDKIMLLHYFMQGYCSEPRTIYKNIRAQEPGRVEIFNLIKDSHKIINLRIINWNLKPRKYDKIELQFYLKQAIDRNLVSDVPLKIGLSSGIDSSLIFALADNDLYDSGLTVKMKNPVFDESDIALKYSKILRKNTIVVEMDNNLNLETINKLISHFDQPFGDSSIIPCYFLSNACKKLSTKVLLGGDGGDEQFYGYDSMHLLHVINSYKIIKRSLYMTLGLLSRLIKNRRLKKMYLFSGDLNDSFYFRNAWILSDGLSKEIKSESLIKSIGYKWDIDLEKTFNLDNLIINQITRTNLISDYLRKTDMMSMYNSVEYRVPFLDEDLFNYSLTIPKTEKYVNRKGKIPLRNMHKNYYDGYGSQQSKKGFSIPYSEYLTTSEKKKMNNTISNFMKIIGKNYLNDQYIENLCDNFININSIKYGVEHSMLQRYFIVYSAARYLTK